MEANSQRVYTTTVLAANHSLTPIDVLVVFSVVPVPLSSF